MIWMRPEALWWLLPALLVVTWFHLQSLAEFSPARRWIATVLRTLVVILVVISACGPVRTIPTQDATVVVAVDRSESIDDAAREVANEIIEELTTASEQYSNVNLQFLPFDEQPGIITETWNAKPQADASGEAAGVNGNDGTEQDDIESDSAATGTDDADSESDRASVGGGSDPLTGGISKNLAFENAPTSGTNLSAALQAAAASVPPSRVARVLLLSDGNDNSGVDPVSTAGEIAAADSGRAAEVTAMPLPGRIKPEIQVTRVSAPASVRRGQPFYVEVVVTSNRDGKGTIDLFRGDVRIDTGKTEYEVKKGETRFRFRQMIDGPKQQVFAARVRGFEDSLLDNNEASAVVHASGRPRVLWIDTDVDATDSIRWALDEQSVDIEVRPPEGIPINLTELEAFECIVLSNVPATSISMRQMDLIRLYVEQLGGGLVMVGGDQSFGLGGYYRTRIEEILPVRSNFDKEREQPSLAMMLVIDKSGSMGGEKIALAREAAIASAELIGPKDFLGVITFDGDSYLVSEMTSGSARGQIIDSIASIEASGGTNMYPAMEMAIEQLAGTPAKLKHVLLMTDGISSPGDFQGAADEMAASRITLSTVALGQGASEALLEELAEIGGGRYYFCEDPAAVPQIFAKETVEAGGSAINELPFVPQSIRPTEVLAGIDLETSPFLLGYVMTRPKPTAEFILASETGDPLLVWWRYGLGVSVAFTSDAKNRWAGEWLSWPDFGRFWAQVLRHAMRKQDAGGLAVSITQEHGTATVQMDAIDDTGNFQSDLQSRLTLIGPDLKPQSFEMPVVAPGRYQWEIPIDSRGTYHLDLAAASPDGTVRRTQRGITVGYPDELRLLPVDAEKLTSITEAGKGVSQAILRANPDAESETDDVQEDPSNGDSVSGEGYRFDAEAYLAAETAFARRPQALWAWFLAAAAGLFVADVAARRIFV
ncbi:MAG: VWA domain-containing protein [Planctomycetota bacterium]